MEQYKEKLKAQNRSPAIFCVVWGIIALLGFVFEAGDILMPMGGDSHWQSMWHGLISGASFAFFVMMLIALIRGIRALKDEKALKKMYIQENDERSIKIWTAARAASMQVFLLLGMAAAIVAGYFSMTVSLTIFACILPHSLIGLGFKIYYSHKF